MLRENLAAVVKMPDLTPRSGSGGGRRCLLTLDPINSVKVIKAFRALCDPLAVLVGRHSGLKKKHQK